MWLRDKPYILHHKFKQKKAHMLRLLLRKRIAVTTLLYRKMEFETKGHVNSKVQTTKPEAARWKGTSKRHLAGAFL
jgi:hypothetical protein